MKLDVDLADSSSWERIQNEVKTHGATQVSRSGTPGLTALSVVEVTFSSGGVPLAMASGQIVHLTDSHAAISFSPPEQARLHGAAFPTPVSDPPDTDEPVGSGADAPMWARYKEMSKIERIKLARHGQGEALRLVLKDKDKSLHSYVLQNPKLTPRELASFIRSGSLSPNLLRQIGQTPDLLRSPVVVEALVIKPATPIKIAINLVPRMKISVARRVSKNNSARAGVLAAIRRRLAKR